MNHCQSTLAILVVLYASIALADDFKTIHGKEYKNVTVTRIEPDGILLKTKSGIVKIYFIELPKDAQERFGYNVQKPSADQNAAPARPKQPDESQKTQREGHGKDELADKSKHRKKQWKHLFGIISVVGLGLASIIIGLVMVVKRQPTRRQISTQVESPKPKRYGLIPPDGVLISDLTAEEVIDMCKARKVITSAAKVVEYKGRGLYGETRPIREFPEFAPHVWDTTLKDAELNPHPDAQCYLLIRGEESGPFLPAQIRAMWKAGSITSDAVFKYPQLPDWRPVKSFCHSAKGDFSIRLSPVPGADRRAFGVLLTIIGIVVTVYFVAFYDVSVRTESHDISGYGTVGGDSVVNLGKQQNRLIGVIIGLALSTAGVIMIYLPAKTNEG